MLHFFKPPIHCLLYPCCFCTCDHCSSLAVHLSVFGTGVTGFQDSFPWHIRKVFFEFGHSGVALPVSCCLEKRFIKPQNTRRFNICCQLAIQHNMIHICSSMSLILNLLNSSIFNVYFSYTIFITEVLFNFFFFFNCCQYHFWENDLCFFFYKVPVL